jgi:hypothetical protein
MLALLKEVVGIRSSDESTLPEDLHTFERRRLRSGGAGPYASCNRLRDRPAGTPLINRGRMPGCVPLWAGCTQLDLIIAIIVY